MPEMNASDSREFQSREFVASAFCPKEDKIIVTLSGAPDWHLIMWNWDPHGNKDKEMMTFTRIGQKGPIDTRDCPFQVSWNPADLNASTMLVTGPNNTYNYLKHKRDPENNPILTHEHSQINNLEAGRNISTNFTCHNWSKSTGMILVCTDAGEMILCQNNGAYKAYILNTPQPSSIECIYSFSSGFLLGVEGSLYVYKDDDGDQRALLVKDAEHVWIKVPDGLDT